MSYKKTFIFFCLAGILLSGCNEKTASSEEENNLLTEKVQEELVLGDLSNLDLSLIESEIPLPGRLYKMNSQGEGDWNDDKISKGVS